ncbi:hypothetical protein HDU81_007768 [Chytriomyces hyalinus]|nr:hypothetical protein HDU81_007768 [Chytriomyces hyalinus]
MPLDFDVVIFGTGVTEAILAGALAKAGKRVCHLDSRDMYGGPGAALALDAFLQNVNGSVTFNNPSDNDAIESDKPAEPANTSPATSNSLLKQSRKYAIEMAPKLIYSNGSLVQTMIDSNVSNYLEFRAVESVSLLWAGAFDTVPCAKEDIFKNESIPLLEKRRLMKLLSKVTEPDESSDAAQTIDPHASLPLLDFLVSQGLSERSRAILLFGVGQFLGTNEAETVSKADGFSTIKRFLESIGRFGATPFLSGVYGTASEISQAFCRVCAVFGGIYMLGFKPLEIHQGSGAASNRYIIKGLQSSDSDANEADEASTITCEWIITSPSSAVEFDNVFKSLDSWMGPRPLSKRISRCVCVTETRLSVGEPGLFVIPPSQNGKNAIVGIQHSENTLVCPSGQYIVYLMAEASSEKSTAAEDLEDALESLYLTVPDSSKPPLKVFYTQEIRQPVEPSGNGKVLVTADFTGASVSLEECIQDAQKLFERIAPGAAFYPPSAQTVDED